MNVRFFCTVIISIKLLPCMSNTLGIFHADSKLKARSNFHMKKYHLRIDWSLSMKACPHEHQFINRNKKQWASSFLIPHSESLLLALSSVTVHVSIAGHGQYQCTTNTKHIEAIFLLLERYQWVTRGILSSLRCFYHSDTLLKFMCVSLAVDDAHDKPRPTFQLPSERTERSCARERSTTSISTS